MENFENEEKITANENPDIVQENDIVSESFESGVTVEESSPSIEININDDMEKVEFNKNKTADVAKSKGLKVFSIIMVLAILVSFSCAAGYFAGKSDRLSISSQSALKKTSMKLKDKPKNENELTAEQIYEKVNKSVVGIMVYNDEGYASQASGVVYSKDGYIITNDHIYSSISAPKFKVYSYDGRVFDAQYVAGDSISDLALIKIKGESGLDVPEFGDSTKLVYGETVFSVGRPGDATISSSISQGIVSNVKRRAQVTSNYSSSLIQIDCDIFEGSSGGALVNAFGQLVGITSAKLTSETSDSMNFAIPTKTLSRILPQLSKDGKVLDRAKLGITYKEISSLEAELNNSSNTGLYVATVGEDSDLYGKVKTGDIITQVNGKAITSANILLDIIEDSYAGDVLKLTVVNSNNETENYQVKLKPNIGESSYKKEKLKNDKQNENGTLPKDDNNNGGTFNFPKGE